MVKLRRKEMILLKLKSKRLMASYIDFIISFYVIYIPLVLIEKLFNNDIVIYIFTIIFLIVFYYLIVYKDLLFRNASLGKKLFGLRVYIHDQIPNKNIIIERNKESFRKFYDYFLQILLNSKSSGDIKYNTEVKKKIK